MLWHTHSMVPLVAEKRDSAGCLYRVGRIAFGARRQAPLCVQATVGSVAAHTREVYLWAYPRNQPSLPLAN